MINFFRKIRLKMAYENNISKYSRYAIGEIVLVVIGILIALQINNWNEARKDKIYETTMLKEILSALNNDFRNFENQLILLKKIQQSALKLAFISNNPSYPQDSIMKHFTILRRGGIAVGINYSPYESLKSSGLNKITNDEIRSNITKFYEVQMRGVEFWVNDFIRKQLEKKENYVDKVFSKNIIPDSILGVRKEYIVNYNLVSNDKEFKEFLSLSSSYIPMAERNIKYAKNGISELKELIETELKNLP